MTLNDLYQDWLRFRKLEVSLITLQKNMRAWERFFASDDIARMDVADITRFYLRAWCSDVVREHSLTRHYFNSEIKAMLNSLLDYAVDLDLAASNVMRSVKINSRLFRAPAMKEDVEDVFSLDEERRILKAAELDAQKHRDAVPLGICILFLTGLRIGELCALKWGDISGNVLHVQRMQVVNTIMSGSCVRNDGYVIVEHTKTSAGYRRIFLPDAAVSYFKQIKRLNHYNGFDTRPDSYIFRRNNKYSALQGDDLCNCRVFDHRLRKYCRQLGFAYVKSPHDVRRTYISQLLESGMNIDTIRRLGGHEQTEMTLAYCRSRVPVEQLREEIENAFKDL